MAKSGVNNEGKTGVDRWIVVCMTTLISDFGLNMFDKSDSWNIYILIVEQLACMQPGKKIIWRILSKDT